MRKFLTALVAVAFIGAGMVVTTQPASAETVTQPVAAQVQPESWDWSKSAPSSWDWGKAAPSSWDWGWDWGTAGSTDLKYGMTPEGSWVPLNPAAEERATATPHNYWQYYPPVVGDPICLKDYTPEVSWWSPTYAASDWSQISYGFHMFWDDMNGEGWPCGSYENHQSVNLYSYDDPNGYCATADISINENNYVLRATVWLNRGNAPYACDGTAVRRTHVMKAAVGYAICCAYHNVYNDSIMSVADASRATVAAVRPTDINAGNCNYAARNC